MEIQYSETNSESSRVSCWLLSKGWPSVQPEHSEPWQVLISIIPLTCVCRRNTELHSVTCCFWTEVTFYVRLQDEIQSMHRSVFWCCKHFTSDSVRKTKQHLHRKVWDHWLTQSFPQAGLPAHSSIIRKRLRNFEQNEEPGGNKWQPDAAQSC